VRHAAPVVDPESAVGFGPRRMVWRCDMLGIQHHGGMPN